MAIQFHPNQKPLGAMMKLLSAYATERATVLDPFAGSGTTLFAARALGRNAVGIEIEERFCELAALRLSQAVLDFRDSPSASEQMSLLAATED